MDVAQFVSEGAPEWRAALFHQLLTDRQLRRGRQMSTAPGAQLHQHGHQLDRLFGQAVDPPLPVGGIVAAREQPRLDEPLQPRGQNVGGDSFF